MTKDEIQQELADIQFQIEDRQGKNCLQLWVRYNELIKLLE